MENNLKDQHYKNMGIKPQMDTLTFEAESVAYAVCQHYGLDTSDYSFGYIAGWSSGKELAELKGSLETIRSTAASLIDTIDGHFAEIQKAQDKEQTTEQAQTPQEATIQPEAEAAAPELPEETAPVQEKEAQTEPEADTGVSSETPQTTQPEQVAPVAPYYTINEAAAKRAKDMNSFSDYKQGSATAEYRHYVDEAVQLAERQKQRVDPMYHEKIDSLLDTYARKLAANMNKGYEIDARVPSILIAGGSNFPTRKKEKQNAARDSNYREWQDIQGLLDKIRSTGMGGISVLREMTKLMPNEDFIYYGDSKHAPYGTKTLEEVRALTIEHITYLIKEKHAKAVAVACNTATSAAVRILRDMYPDLPLVGVEPAIKPAVLATGHAKVVVMATPMTLREEKFHKLESLYDEQADIYPLPCPGLMEFVEQGILSGEKLETFLHNLLDPYKDKDITGIVLGCTHYPFLKETIQKIAGPSVTIFDGGYGTAKELLRRLRVADLAQVDNMRKGSVTFLNSSDDPALIQRSKKLLNS